MGSTLTQLLLAAGHNVRVLDYLTYGGDPLLGVWSHPGFEFVRGDIRDRETVRTAVSGRDAVVHLAAIVGDPACAREPDLGTLDQSRFIPRFDRGEAARRGRSDSSSPPPVAITAK